MTVQRLLRAVKKLQNQFDKGLKGAAEKSRAVHGGPVSWASLALLVCSLSVISLAGFIVSDLSGAAMQSDGAAVARTGPGVGKAAIGDICPDEVTKLAEAVDEIEIQDTDFSNDLPELLCMLLYTCGPLQLVLELSSIAGEVGAEFHPRLVGLTGSVKAIQEVAREYRVYHMKTEDEGNDYLVDHSIFMMMVKEFLMMAMHYKLLEVLNNAHVAALKNWRLGAVVKIEDKF
ncbi:hypothetical protein CY35_06G034500 [Sphagnum magellanicum]|nr:hypothetical protein CY35_06G034500 [Sphagnum magellanicum]